MLGLVSSVLCQEIVLAGKNVSEMSILCRVGRKTLTQSKVDVVRAAGKKLNWKHLTFSPPSGMRCSSPTKLGVSRVMTHEL